MICKYCGKEISFNYFKNINNEMAEMQACFTCHFWLDQKRIDDNLPWYGGIVVNGRHYRTRNIGIQNDPRYLDWMRGCGGSAYKLTHQATGESVETNDLWFQGTIPDRFRHLLPDNATIEPLGPPNHTNAFSKVADSECGST